MIELHLFIMVVLLGTNTPEDALPPFMMGTLSGKLVLVGASVVYLEVPVLPLAL